MKVCLLNESFPPVIDGVVNVVMNYAQYLQSDHNAEVAVGTPKYPDADYTQYPYEVIPYQSFDTGNATSGYRAGNPLAEKAIGKMAEFDPDIIHAHCPASSLVIARILREQTGAPIVFTYHTKYDIDIERWVKVKSVAQEAIKAMVGNIEACDEVWVVSRGAGESLKALGYSGEYRVMNNGVDFEKGRVCDEDVAKATEGYDLPEGVPMYLFVGRLMTYKGLPLILDALKIVAEAGQDFRMVFVGKGPDRELLEKQAEDLGIADKCIFVGPIYDRDVLRAWNTRADLFLFPSTFDTNGLVVREAAACGLASVLIKDSCASEGVTDGRNGFIIEENASAMAALLLKQSKDLAHIHEVGQNAMDEIYMSWKDCVTAAYKRYQFLIAEKKNGILPKRKKLATDVLVKAAAEEMEKTQKHRRVMHEWFDDFKETSVGMMENIEAAQEEVRSRVDRAEEKVRDRVDHAGEKVREHIDRAGEEMRGHAKKVEDHVRGSLQLTEEQAEKLIDQLAENTKNLP